MTKKEVHFKIFANGLDLSLVELYLKQAVFPQADIKVSRIAKIKLNLDEILIFGIRNLEDPFFNELMDARKNLTNEIVVVTDSQDSILLCTLARMGFNDIYLLPYESQKLKSALLDLIQNYSESVEEKSSDFSDISKDKFDIIIGSSPELINSVNLARRIAENPSVSVLLLGDTGTGKGLLAKTIHEHSPRSNAPFIDIVCSAIPVTLLESELFGYERGAFTDAKNRKIGLFELAENGTIFLDEIGDLTPDIQVKLLRAIDEKVVRRLGGTVDISINARIISATNRDLSRLVEQKLFRIDLYHRLNVVSIKIPPLRERGNDIIKLAEHFIKELSEKFNKPRKKIDKNLKEFLLKYEWPGNVRELKNAMERAVLLSETPLLMVEDLFHTSVPQPAKSSLKKNENIKLDLNLNSVNLHELTKIYASEVLQRLNGNKSQTARILGISRPKLDRLLD